MNFFKITFDNGNVIKTSFNGTLNEAKNYYLNEVFEWKEGELPSRAISVELLS